MPTDFRSTAGGDGIVVADIFSVTTQKITFNPPSLATGVFATSSPIAVNGVELGDAISLHPPYTTQGIIYQASVSTDGNIVINLFNASAGTVDLAEGSWGVSIKRGV